MNIVLLATVAAALAAARGAALLNQSATRRPLLTMVTLLCAMSTGLLGAGAIGVQSREIDERVESRVETALLASTKVRLASAQAHTVEDESTGRSILASVITGVGGFLAAVGCWTLARSPERRTNLTRLTMGFALASASATLLGVWVQASQAPREIDRKTAEILSLG